ncbi:MAG: Ig-like domain-containing protein [Muribaculaceae bacterium]
MKWKKPSLRDIWGVMACALTLWVVASCASIGRPQGGARDVTPPAYVRSNPPHGTLNFKGERVEAFFDENIQLDDAFNKVIVSPTQKITPVVRSFGRRVTVELRDTLKPNTTYTIDFADAIQDLNEGNVLDGFALDFSTGDSIDTLRLSGIVLEARTLEPAQAMTVGIYREPADTAITTLPFERIARTNQLGQFTVRNLKAGNYAVYAINDLNRDNKWDRSEDIAFLGHLATPSVEAITVTDTIRTAAGTDSLATRPGTAYYPNDLLLTWFNEGYKSQYLKDYKRPERRKITLEMGAPADSLPEIAVVKGPQGRSFSEMAVLQHNATNDTLTYWLHDPELIAADSLMLSVRHLNTDTLDRIVWKTDTLRFFWRDKDKKKKKKDEEADTLPKPIELLPLTMTSPSDFDVYQPLRLGTSTPIARADTAAFHLEMLVDTIWTAVPHSPVRADTLNPLTGLVIDFDTGPGHKYRIRVDSLGVENIYGLHNKDFSQEFKVRELEEYSNLVLNITPDSLPMMVELLSEADNPVRVVSAEKGKAIFRYVNPGTYYARLWIDADSNGIWTTGCVIDSLQPEEVYYYPRKIDLKANWDVENSWDIYELPVDAQKPMKIRKNKPKPKKGEEPLPDEDVELDEWGEPIDPTRTNNLTGGRNGNNRYDRNNRNNNRLGGNNLRMGNIGR